MKKNKGQIEADISEAIIKFEKEYMGRGPEETKTYIIDDMLIVRLKRVLTPAEQQLAKSTEGATGRALVKQIRAELIEKAMPLLNAVIAEITGKKIISLHTDISTVTGERMIIFILDGSPLEQPDKAQYPNK
ncbi:MAG: hypothetical protein A2Y12_14380 [Planctomycetes bacterium GWF2_42_9]|nr:MAG: hypothetical protein A2Y12_14380 [Planctomycetes bacterium GWF2_42_9]HAL45800.1 hypothetical protein [Phycisphaerales bacterium]